MKNIAFIIVFLFCIYGVQSAPLGENSPAYKVDFMFKNQPQISSSSSEVIASSSSVEEHHEKPAIKVSKNSITVCGELQSGYICDKRDEHIYKTVALGKQIWIAENMDYEVEGSWCYEDKAENCAIYGRLYQWATAMNLDSSFNEKLAGKKIKKKHRGICPEGFRIPTPKDLEILTAFVDEETRKQGYIYEKVGWSLKTTERFEDGYFLGIDRYGFNAKGAGFRDENGEFSGLNEETNFWTTSESKEISRAPYWNLFYGNHEFLGHYKTSKKSAFSVRCLK